jgi:hypothetical protein
MYRFGRRLAPWHNYQKRALTMVIMALLVIAVIVGWYIDNNSGTTIIHNAGAKTTTVNNKPSVQTFNETVFTIQLPNDWKLINHSISPYDIYTWQDTTKYQDNRNLNLYVDTIPTTLAVSRLQPVTAEGDLLQLGELSDTCINFTGSPVSSAQAAQSLPNQVAKWQGINFICDLSDYNNNSIGTSSQQGVNTVTLTGPTTGRHSFFFLYTDHNISPNYTIFSDALLSFRVK